MLGAHMVVWGICLLRNWSLVTFAFLPLWLQWGNWISGSSCVYLLRVGKIVNKVQRTKGQANTAFNHLSIEANGSYIYFLFPHLACTICFTFISFTLHVSLPPCQAKLGNSWVSPNVGHLILKYLCPALHEVLQDGLKAYVLDLIIGQRRCQPWSLVEASTQLGESMSKAHVTLFSFLMYFLPKEHI